MLHMTLFSSASRIPVIDDTGNIRIRKSVIYFLYVCACVVCFVRMYVVFWVCPS